VLRETQASDDAACSIKLTGIRFDGSLKKLPDPKYRIEYLGDSYTSGEGAMGAPQDQEWIPVWFSATYNFARVSAQELGAESRIISQSGWGTLASYDNNPNNAISKIYEYICARVTSGTGSNMNKNDFNVWQPDVIVIALGTNDKSGFNQNAYSAGGTTFKNSPAIFEDGAYKFLEKLRELNPKSHLAWCFFENENQLTPILERMVDKFKKNHDSKASTFYIPYWKSTGAKGHPNAEDHIAGGKIVAKAIAKILGISYSG
jgi:lysophospholipase L1-like esterase